MGMPRFFVEEPIVDKENVTISGQEARHIQRALRLGVGDNIDLFDGTGREYHGQITRRDRQGVAVRVIEATMPERESPLRVVMGQSLVKGDKMDLIIQRITELGVSTLIPFVSHRSVPSLEGEKAERRLARWTQIAVESSKQCGRVIPMKVETVRQFSDVLWLAPAQSSKIILWERASEKLRSLFRVPYRPNERSPAVYCLVGPEGGFSDQEIRKAEEAQFLAVNLGPRILRVETAGPSLVSILQYEWGDIG
jgi:16S rRNA (uracil1498-N3)-methyltransferase